MSRQHYYLIASLPYLKFNGKPPMKSADFLERCSFDCTEDQLHLLTIAGLDPDNADGSEKGTLLENYWKWEKQVRNALVSLRAKDLDKDAKLFLKDGQSSPGVNALAENAFREKSPLLAENILDQARWNKIEELKSSHIFDFSFLIAYRLQLRLLERQADFDEEQGFEAYQDLYKKIMENTDNDIIFGDENG